MHRNVAGVLSKISGPLAAENVNIENMVSRSRGNYAYTIVEIIGQISESALNELSKIEETIRIRVIS